MGIFSWLFNRPKAVKSNTAAKHQPAQAQSQVAQPDLQAIPQIQRDKHFLRVDSLSFSGVYQLSKSKDRLERLRSVSGSGRSQRIRFRGLRACRCEQRYRCLSWEYA